MLDKLILRITYMAVIVMMSAAISAAQTINGTISGTIVDAQGAAIAGATVTATNAENGFSRSVTTSGEGQFRVAGLPVGTYSVKVEANGFAPKTDPKAQVSVGTETELRFELTPGSVEVVVEVTSAGELLDTTQSQVQNTVSTTQILELPGRNTLNGLALLVPGVLPNAQNRPGSGFAVNGNRTRSNNFTIDGANNNDQSLSIPRQNLPPEALQEFQIITNTFAAEFGRNAGSYVNQITRSGTNDFSGAAFWIWGGNGLDALTTNQQRIFNDNIARGRTEEQARRAARSVTVANTYGGTFGGPIVKNHTFFFTSLDFTDSRQTVSSSTRAALDATNRARLQMPGRGFDSQALSFLFSTFPEANDPTFQTSVALPAANSVPCPPPPPDETNPNYCNVISFTTFNRAAGVGIPYGNDFDRWLMKVNTRMFENDQLSFRYLYDYFLDPGIPASLPGQELGNELRNDSFTINHALPITARWLNEARFTYSRRKANFLEDYGFAFGVGGTGTAFTLGNQNMPQYRTDNVYEFTDNISFTPSNHAFKFGYNLLIYKLASFFAPDFDGTVQYGSLANFLTDTNATYSRYAGDGLTDATTYEHSWFAQDDWRVNNDLTLNLGLRYEYVTAPFGYFSDAKADINNFAPRLGFAWNPKDMFGGKMVLRGGFAVAYDQVFQNILLNNSRNFPRGVTVQFANISGQRPFINLPSAPTPDQYAGDPNLLAVRLFSPGERIRQPMSKQWTLGIQYQLFNDWIAKAEYIGTLGSNLVREIETNYGFCGRNNPLSTTRTDCPTRADIASPERLDPTRGSVLIGQGIANSSYHAGQFSLERRLAKLNAFGVNFGDFLMNANYTYSAFISEADDILGGQANRTLPADPRNPKLDKARSGFDQPHRFVMNFVWGAPEVYQGSSNFFAKQIVGRLLSGWQLSAVGTYASGTPFSVINANNALGILPGQIGTVHLSQRVSVNPNGQYPLVSTPTAPNPNAYFIVNGAGSGILGNLGANTERTGTTQNWNAALVKNFRTFGERQRLQLRMEVSNVFNHRNFTLIPVNTIGNSVPSTFLNLGFTNVVGRQFTFGARYFF